MSLGLAQAEGSAEGKEYAHLPCSPTEDPEVTALPIGACRVGRQAEVVASVLGKDWLDPQGALGQNLQPGMEGGVAMETSRPATLCEETGPLVPLAFPARGC